MNALGASYEEEVAEELSAQIFSDFRFELSCALRKMCDCELGKCFNEKETNSSPTTWLWAEAKDFTFLEDLAMMLLENTWMRDSGSNSSRSPTQANSYSEEPLMSLWRLQFSYSRENIGYSDDLSLSIE